MKNFQYTEGRRYLKIFIITIHKKEYLSFLFLTSNIRILLMRNSSLFDKIWFKKKMSIQDTGMMPVVQNKNAQ